MIAASDQQTGIRDTATRGYEVASGERKRVERDRHSGRAMSAPPVSTMGSAIAELKKKVSEDP